jgi:hypothetical protein
MFDRFIRLARAKKAFREARFADALRLAADPLIEGDRRAEAIRIQAERSLARQARTRLDDGDLQAAQADLRRLQRAGATATDLALAVDAAVAEETTHSAEARAALAEVRRLFERGELAAAETVLATLRAGKLLLDVEPLQARIEGRRREARALVEQALRDATPEHLLRALERFGRAIAMDRGLPVSSRNDAVEQLSAAAAEFVEGRDGAADLAGALSRYGRVIGGLPELADALPMKRVAERLVGAVDDAVRECDVDGGARIAYAAHAARLPVPEALQRLLAALRAAGSLAGCAQPTGRKYAPNPPADNCTSQRAPCRPPSSPNH